MVHARRHTHIEFQIDSGVAHGVDVLKFAKSGGLRRLLKVRDVVFFEPSICEEFNSQRVEGLWSGSRSSCNSSARGDQCMRHRSCKFVLRELHSTPGDVDTDSPV